MFWGYLREEEELGHARGVRILGRLILPAQHRVVLFERCAVFAEASTTEPGFTGPLSKPIWNGTNRLDLHDGIAVRNDEFAESGIVGQKDGKLRPTEQEIIEGHPQEAIGRTEGIAIVADLHGRLVPRRTHSEHFVDDDAASATNLIIHPTKRVIIAQGKGLRGFHRHGEAALHAQAIQLVLHLEEAGRRNLGLFRSVDADPDLAATPKSPLLFPVALAIGGIVILRKDWIIP